MKPSVEVIIRDFGIVWHQVAPQLGNRTRPTDLAVLYALRALAVKHQTYEPLTPVRTLAVAAGLSVSTVSGGLARLRAGGAIRSVERADGRAPDVGRGIGGADAGVAACHGLNRPRAYLEQTELPGGMYTQSVRLLHPAASPVPRTPPNLPIWQDQSARGKTAWLLHGAADLATPLSVAGLADLVMVTLRTARRLLPILTDVDRVLIRNEAGLYLLGEVDPGSVVFPNAEQRITDRRNRFDFDRRGYAEKVRRNWTPPAESKPGDATASHVAHYVSRAA